MTRYRLAIPSHPAFDDFPHIAVQSRGQAGSVPGIVNQIPPDSQVNFLQNPLCVRGFVTTGCAGHPRSNQGGLAVRILGCRRPGGFTALNFSLNVGYAQVVSRITSAELQPAGKNSWLCFPHQSVGCGSFGCNHSVINGLKNINRSGDLLARCSSATQRQSIWEAELAAYAWSCVAGRPDSATPVRQEDQSPDGDSAS